MCRDSLNQFVFAKTHSQCIHIFSLKTSCIVSKGKEKSRTKHLQNRITIVIWLFFNGSIEHPPNLVNTTWSQSVLLSIIPLQVSFPRWHQIEHTYHKLRRYRNSSITRVHPFRVREHCPIRFLLTLLISLDSE